MSKYGGTRDKTPGLVPHMLTLTEFYNPNLIDVEFDDLKSACDAVFISLTAEIPLLLRQQPDHRINVHCGTSTEVVESLHHV